MMRMILFIRFLEYSVKNPYTEDFFHTNAVCVGNIVLAPKFRVLQDED